MPLQTHLPVIKLKARSLVAHVFIDALQAADDSAFSDRVNQNTFEEMKK